MRNINNLILKSSALVILLLATARADNICHRKPNAACLDCCSKTNTVEFHDKVAVICSKRPSISKADLDSFYKKEAAVLASPGKSDSGRGSETQDIYIEYLSQTCTEDGNIKNPELAYADCAKGCPPPPKRKTKK